MYFSNFAERYLMEKIYQQEIEQFNKYYARCFKSKTKLLQNILGFLYQHKGKLIRPQFVIAWAKIFENNISERTFKAASLIELLHTATLVHDDVVDDAYFRRNKFSIKALWGNKLAVLSGDYLLSRGLLLALENKEFDFLEILAVAVKEMSEGELLQFEKARLGNLDEPTYFNILSQKTASLLASACALGAASANASAHQIQLAHQFGVKMGIAFQLKDDLLDFATFSTGKSKLNDLKQKKMSLPIIYLLRKVKQVEKEQIQYLIKNITKNSDAIPKLYQIIDEYKALEYTEKIMNTYLSNSLTSLNSLPDSEAKSTLIKLTNQIVNREN